MLIRNSIKFYTIKLIKYRETISRYFDRGSLILRLTLVIERLLVLTLPIRTWVLTKDDRAAPRKAWRTPLELPEEKVKSVKRLIVLKPKTSKPQNLKTQKTKRRASHQKKKTIYYSESKQTTTRGKDRRMPELQNDWKPANSKRYFLKAQKHISFTTLQGKRHLTI